MSYGLKELTLDALKLNVKVAPQELAKARLETCELCPKYVHTRGTCSACGCYMPAKTKLTKATCPLKKW